MCIACREYQTSVVLPLACGCILPLTNNARHGPPALPSWDPGRGQTAFIRAQQSLLSAPPPMALPPDADPDLFSSDPPRDPQQVLDDLAKEIEVGKSLFVCTAPFHSGSLRDYTLSCLLTPRLHICAYGD